MEGFFLPHDLIRKTLRKNPPDENRPTARITAPVSAHPFAARMGVLCANTGIVPMVIPAAANADPTR